MYNNKPSWYKFFERQLSQVPRCRGASVSLRHLSLRHLSSCPQASMKAPPGSVPEADAVGTGDPLYDKVHRSLYRL